ncbi:oxygen-insensitive NAD(P)H nitroreductase [Polaribacter undariae]|uniref:Oxygen-insensitive NAD(P)H nitroreductase n=1 Tax=Polaribacter sejongensis TaxID=985043 RepID=A0AAJ1VHS1_9FLAO|nr:oxygen-insensitive NAD(P)H nitroreductase [Polaribacter undariae]MDN3620679.1 oxygen-insensitive NAD(P)H nitroreductase [Polaribacter undariae]UWD32494.1 oxygen-insensitive NAD(P)H nitroreductase [Polaribacter undariae]
MNLSEILNSRYTVKEFDATKKVSTEDFEQIKSLLRLSPSSINLQPWHFIVADSAEGKARIAKGTEETFPFNTPKVLDASHVIVITARTNVDENYINSILDKEDEDGRYAKQEYKDQAYAGRMMFANLHRYDLKDVQPWIEKQVYLNMGSLLTGAAVLGIDACPMEGVDVKALDKEFGLHEKGYTALAVVSLGYRKDTDFNSKLPKSRFSEETIITKL